MLLRYRYKHNTTNEIIYEESFTAPVTNVKPNSLTIVDKLESNTTTTITVDVSLTGSDDATIPLTLGTYTVKVNKKFP